MTRILRKIEEALSGIEAVVCDQWGVLHNGSKPYPYVRNALGRVKSRGLKLAVLSNSGKRASPNSERLRRMGFEPGLFTCLITSGEVLWQELKDSNHKAMRLFPIQRSECDALEWARGLDVGFSSIDRADAVLLMGLPDDACEDSFSEPMKTALRRNIPIFCSNPDRASPRDGGKVVRSPGTLAHDHQQAGGTVRFYGKPHLSVFRATERALGVDRNKILMVGDSLEHDIAGGYAAGWKTLLVQGGLHARNFQLGATTEVLSALAKAEDAPLPDYSIDLLR